MAVIYTNPWYDGLRQMIDGCAEFAEKAPQQRLAMALEVMGDGASPYVPADGAIHYMIVLDHGKVAELSPLPERHPGKGLDFRFTASASVWEGVAAGHIDPITAGMRGTIRVRGDMRVLMRNADAVKILVDLYGDQGHTDWPKGKPPYG